MGDAAYLRPNNPGDPPAGDLHAWCVELEQRLLVSGHSTTVAIDDTDPCDYAGSSAALGSHCDAVFFFGHGTSDQLIGTNGQAAVDRTNIANASGKAIIAVACLAGRSLGPDAIGAGVEVFLGWNAKLLWLGSPVGQLGPFGLAIVSSLEILGQGARLEEVKERLRDELDAVAEYYRTGLGSGGANSLLAYYGAAAAAGQVALCGNEKQAPL
jgi:hypothetical protein